MKTENQLMGELRALGITNINSVHYNCSSAALVEGAIRRGEGSLSHLGPLVVRTGQHTGRSPNDKFIVREPSSEKNIWWGKVNREISPEKYERIYAKMMAYIQNKEICVQDMYAGHDVNYRLPIRVIP